MPGPHRDSDYRADLAAVRASFGTCEARLEQRRNGLPTIAIVGASYTAGVGPDNPRLSWAVDLARLLHWNAVIYGVPGAGYENHGTDGLGPVNRMLTDERLHGLAPKLVIVQAGHDDSGTPFALEKRLTSTDVTLIRTAAAQAKVALLTVFSPPQGSPPAAVQEVDRGIVSGGRDADSRIIIMDPLTGHWKFARVRHGTGLHPTAAGDAWIARKVLSILGKHGIEPAAVPAATPVICDVGVGVGKTAPAA